MAFFKRELSPVERFENALKSKLAEREKKQSGRNVDYNVVKPDLLGLSCRLRLQKFR